jgi:uncharacterized membrane protein YqjE
VAAEPNLVGRVADLASDLLHMVQTRLELIGLGFERERDSVLLQLKLAMTSVVTAGVAAVSAVLWVALVLPPAIRPLALGGLTIAFAAISLGSLVLAQRNRRHQKQIFQNVIAQLGRDRLTLGAAPHNSDREDRNEPSGDSRQGP